MLMNSVIAIIAVFNNYYLKLVLRFWDGACEINSANRFLKHHIHHSKEGMIGRNHT